MIAAVRIEITYDISRSIIHVDASGASSRSWQLGQSFASFTSGRRPRFCVPDRGLAGGFRDRTLVIRSLGATGTGIVPGNTKPLKAQIAGIAQKFSNPEHPHN